MKDHPTLFGVFKPVGHVVLSFASQAQADGAAKALRDTGFGDADIGHYSPERMLAQADRDIANAGAFASMGQELNLVKAHRALAVQGQSFLVVKAPHDVQVEQVTAVALRFKVSRAQRYGLLLIEELVPPGTTDHQTAESPDTGLDAQTASGVEGAPR